jgi:hypothetical protein
MWITLAMLTICALWLIGSTIYDRSKSDDRMAVQPR